MLTKINLFLEVPVLEKQALDLETPVKLYAVKVFSSFDRDDAFNVAARDALIEGEKYDKHTWNGLKGSKEFVENAWAKRHEG